MMIQAVLSNPHHPEYGVATIPFPIPHDQYAHCMELLEALEIGDAVKADCKVEKLDSFFSVLKCTEMLTVNVEELNYLAKRLESFDDGEAAQFQAMAHKLELFELKDLINLTFCCQQATVITDFSDLAAIGRDHYMNLHGGSASVEALEALDGEETARRLIESGSGTITPYGVVYYGQNTPPHQPLTQRKEFRSLKNWIIREAENISFSPPADSVEPDEKQSVEKTSPICDPVDVQPTRETASVRHIPANAAMRLLHHMGQIFRESMPVIPPALRIDSKRRRRLQEKRMALGHKRDDHEDEQFRHVNDNTM